MEQQKLLTRVMTLYPLSLYLDYIFMYFYFFRKSYRWSQNGQSGVNFTERGFLSFRGCSQPIFHGWSKQEWSQQGSRDRCSVEDPEIQRKEGKKKETMVHIYLVSCTSEPLGIFSLLLNQDYSYLIISFKDTVLFISYNTHLQNISE